MEKFGFSESDLKHNEVVEKFINQRSEKTSGEFYDTISGEVMDSDFIEKAREAKMETFKTRK